MNKTILITGANAGIGKEVARQLALKNSTQKIILACRNKERAIQAKNELESQTGKKIFEILLMDVSKISSVEAALERIQQPIDAVILNAGGTGGKNPDKRNENGVTQIAAINLLGHVVFLEKLIQQHKLNHVALFASSEAARGIDKMGMKQPKLSSSSTEEFKAVLDGSFFQNKFDPMQVYGYIKYIGALWISHLATQHQHIKFISMSPGGTRGTKGFDDLPFIQKIFFKYIGMPFILPIMGLSHSLNKGAQRFVDGIENPNLKSGVFYGSKEKVLTGPIVEQHQYFKDLNQPRIQKNAFEAIHSFL
jgi:NAD(P)-dependent dehydrogenase (short-subunit alcohol dehydrogenase family)